jgi:MinD-like ATPase involved in chromosome partitioning or flagellar assembly
MLIALASVKASPGVTTTALALAAAWPAQRKLLIEADPAGGDLGPWLGVPPSPGLASLATAARHDHGRGLAWRHARELAAGLHLIVAPAGAEQAAACLTALPGAGIAPLAEGPGITVADCGRLDPGSAALAIAAQAALTLVVVRPRAGELSHLALRLPAMAAAGLRLGLLLAPDAGRLPPEASYPAQEIAATLEIPVRGVLPADARTVTHLVSKQGDLGGAAARLPLARAAASLATALQAAHASPEWLPAAQPGGQPRRGVSAGERRS